MEHSRILNDYFIEILRKKNENSTVAFGNVFEKLLKSNSLTLGPISRLWMRLEEARESKTGSADISQRSQFSYLTSSAPCGTSRQRKKSLKQRSWRTSWRSVIMKEPESFEAVLHVKWSWEANNNFSKQKK